MPTNISQLIASLPSKPARSRLDPYRKDIMTMRDKGYSYKEIAAFLKQHLNLQIAPSTLCWFLYGRRVSKEEPTQTNAKESVGQLEPPSALSVKRTKGKQSVHTEKPGNETLDGIEQPTLPFLARNTISEQQP